jgi:hypothetical protein
MIERRLPSPAPMMIRLARWRSLAHSYSIVHQWHAIELSRRSDNRIGMRDLPPLPGSRGPRWKPVSGLFDPVQRGLVIRTWRHTKSRRDCPNGVSRS